MADDDFLVGQGNSDARNFNFHLLRSDNELYREEDYIPHGVIQVKRKETKKNGEEWFILEDKQIALHLKEYRLNNQERAFLRTPNGMICLVKSFKEGNTTVSKLLIKIKEAMEK